MVTGVGSDAHFWYGVALRWTFEMLVLGGKHPRWKMGSVKLNPVTCFPSGFATFNPGKVKLVEIYLPPSHFSNQSLKAEISLVSPSFP